MNISKSFMAFQKEAASFAKAYGEMVDKVGKSSALDEKTKHLSYIAVLAATRRESGLGFHVSLAKKAGASRDEVISAVMVGLPAVGNAVTECLPVVLEAYDEQ